jgi:hypothetical protein
MAVVIHSRRRNLCNPHRVKEAQRLESSKVLSSFVLFSSKKMDILSIYQK